MRNVAECMYRMWVLGERDPEVKYKLFCWGLLAGHPVVRSFFHAFYVITSMERIGLAVDEATETDRVSVAAELYRKTALENKLFPAETNVHCKWLLNDGRQETILLAIQALLSDTTTAPAACKVHSVIFPDAGLSPPPNRSTCGVPAATRDAPQRTGSGRRGALYHVGSPRFRSDSRLDQPTFPEVRC